MMLRTNLATRPFYNERIVYLVLGLAALAVLAVTAYNVGSWLSLRRHQADLVAQVFGAESRAAGLQREAARLRRSLNRADVDAVAKAAGEANDLIDRRTFSWTDLLGRFESTLPADVRIVSVSPKVDRDGNRIVRVVVAGHQAEDVETFVEKLAETKSFDRLLSQEEIVNQDGLLEVTLEGRYLGSVAKPVAGAR